ncbi:hypothetical protein DE146DRAFT_766851 [Phaeosphaeria sp. MPI-PUGE-AT-0046c]|nr:hypothetical protein DE146DRAFT_766851 [Phaeosphaeria sp. MPI-PUGE-AT-0046c]
MASTGRSLPLPCELLFEVFGYLEEYQPPERGQKAHLYGHLTWLRVAKSAKEDICNVRSVCKSFRETSVSSFAMILGDRYFRLTSTGLQDLQGIAAVEGLAPWIKALTFGSADVAPYTPSLYQSTSLERLDEATHKQLSSIDKAWKEYRQLSPEALECGLRDALKVFPELRSLRIVVNDRPDYLEGWLNPAQKRYTFDNFDKGTLYWDFDGPEDFYRSRGWDAAHNVLRAANEAGICVQYVRFDIPSNVQYSHPEKIRYLLPSTLHTLCMPVDDHSLGWEGSSLGWESDERFFKALENMDKLCDLTLHGQMLYIDPLWGGHLFHALRNTSTLRRLDLNGKWTLSQTNLTDFVEQHASSLQHLLFEGVWIHGDWLSTLHALAHLTHGHLKYLSVKHVGQSEREDLWNSWISNNFDQYSRSEWPVFTCVTDFGPKFCLIVDSDEGGEDNGGEDVGMDGADEDENGGESVKAESEHNV